jgi:hypothetical protein
MIIEEELEHFGVKGMKWGVRKNNSRESSGSQKMSRKKKILIGAGITAGVVGGAAATHFLLAHNKNVKMTKLKDAEKGRRAVQAFMQAKDHRRTMDEIMIKQNRLVREANKDLRKLYNLNDTPIHMRDYLKGFSEIEGKF